MNSPHPNLRPWRDADLDRLIALHHHPEVYPWLGGLQSREVVTGIYDRLREQIEDSGSGAWVVCNEADELVGVAGLDPIHAGMPLLGVEALWRLHPEYWGRGLVTQTMQAVLKEAFQRSDFDGVWTYTAEANVRSLAVMERLGFRRLPERDFNHPRLELGHPLSRHVVYWMSPERGDAS